MNALRVCLVAALLGAASIVCVAADPFPGGGVIASVKDDVPAVKPQILTDAVSIYLERAYLPRETGWFTSDSELGFAFKITVNFKKKTSTAGNSTTYESDSITVTRAYKFSVKQAGGGNIYIPLSHLPVLDQYRLSDASSFYVSSVTTELTLCAKKDRTNFSKVMESIFALSKSLPIPANPYTPYIDALGKTFGQITQEAVDEGAETTPFANVGLRFTPGEGGKNIISESGLYAIIMGTSATGGNRIDINAIDASKLKYSDTTGLTYGTTGPLNAHMVFRVAYTQDPLTAEMDPLGTAQRLTPQIEPALQKAKSLPAKLPTANLESLLRAGRALDPIAVRNAVTELNAVTRSQ